METQTIKARIRQRIDTAANWSAANPVLLEGEVGYISDDHTRYKIGDGVTAWDGLPYRGFPGQLVQGTGSDPMAVMSQRAVSEELTRIDENKQDTITDLAAIRDGASKGKTALQSFIEIDPVFGGSPAAKITDDDIERWNASGTGEGTITEIRMNGESKGTSGVVDLGTVITAHQDISGLATKDELGGKVDKEDGKQLTTEDFTAELKAKLEGLSNFDSTEIDKAIAGLQTQLDTLTGGNASKAIESFNEIIAFLEGVEDSEDLAGIIASIEKQIADVQSAIPTKASQLTNDAGYLTAHQDISGLATKTEVNGKQDKITDLDAIRAGAAAGATALQAVPASYVTEDELTAKNYVNTSALNSALAAKKDFAIVSQASSAIASAQPNTCYIINLATAGDVRISAFVEPSAAVAEYMVMFKGASTVTLPTGVLWANGEQPAIDSAVHYELSIVGVMIAGSRIYKAILTPFA